jgi:4-hydroxyphenylpyruvate dioxygenase
MPNAKVAAESPLGYPVVRGFDHIELFVGNVRQSGHYYHTVWGFQPVAASGTDGGPTDRTSIVMRQSGVTLLLTGATNHSSPVAEHLRLHGEGVVTIGLAVDDAEAAFSAAVARGATPVSTPVVAEDNDGRVARSEVLGFGGFTHAFIERSSDKGSFLPGFRALPSRETKNPILEELDHVAVAVEPGTLDAWVDFYQTIFGFDMIHKEDVATSQTGMNSKVVQHPSGACKFPLVEPAIGRRKSQVQRFLDSYGGPGVQHLALQTSDIVATVSKLRMNGVEFLSIPPTYYDELENRVGSLAGDLAAIRDLGILVDHDEWGRLLQIFAQPFQDRPTLFFEIIERRGARGFGGGNIRALFEAIEREQISRGGS